MKHFSRARLAALFVLFSPVSCDYLQNAEEAFKVLQQWYNTSAGLWDTAGWWNGANCLTVIADLAAVDDSIKPSATSIFANTYTNAPPQNPSSNVFKSHTQSKITTVYGKPPRSRSKRNHPLNSRRPDSLRASPRSDGGNAPGFTDSCYDDNGWWALGWIAAYDLTGEPDYLATAEGLFEQMAAAWPSPCNDGGIPWCSDSSYVNAIANELFLSLAAHLANRVADKTAYYVDWARKEWSWFRGTGMINAQGSINDGLGDPDASGACANNGGQVWSYNQGVVLGALAELAAADAGSADAYLGAAADIARAAIAQLVDAQTGVLHDACEPDDCFPDGTQFKGVFARNLARLHAVAPDEAYTKVIAACADAMWAKDRDENNGGALGVVWDGPPGVANASTHSSGMDALVAAVAMGLS